MQFLEYEKNNNRFIRAVQHDAALAFLHPALISHRVRLNPPQLDHNQAANLTKRSINRSLNQSIYLSIIQSYNMYRLCYSYLKMYASKVASSISRLRNTTSS